MYREFFYSKSKTDCTSYSTVEKESNRSKFSISSKFRIESQTQEVVRERLSEEGFRHDPGRGHTRGSGIQGNNTNI